HGVSDGVTHGRTAAAGHLEVPALGVDLPHTVVVVALVPKLGLEGDDELHPGLAVWEGHRLSGLHVGLLAHLGVEDLTLNDVANVLEGEGTPGREQEAVDVVVHWFIAPLLFEATRFDSVAGWF